MERVQLGKYELLERLGQGGMGEVWKARDTQLQRYVAIKLLHADLQADPDFVTYFMREARLVASLHHPNIVQIHDFQLSNVPQGTSVRAYMVMDYIKGGTLADAIRNTVRKGLFWPANDIVYLFTAISLALDYAHEQGMIHRDIKPANIMLDSSIVPGNARGEPILTDFGIARLQGAGGSTVTRSFVGTPLYISPEQAQSRPVDARSDLYSLGIILYEMLTGITPFRGDNALAIMMRHVQENPPAPALINPHISPALSAVVLQSIAKDPGERFPSATAMTVALSQAFNAPIPARLDRPGEKNAPLTYNPLQPLPGVTPAPPVAPPTTFTPTARGHPESRPFFSPGVDAYRGLAQTEDNEATRITPASNVRAAPNGQVPFLPEQPERKLPVRSSRRWLLPASLVCIFLLLIGISAAFVAPRFFSPSSTPTPGASGGIVGQIRFTSSSSAPRNTFDQLQIDLTNVPSPPGQQKYYAWLEQANSETLEIPHWALQITNGTIHHTYASSTPLTDLFASSNLFLITAEDAASTPVVPIPASGRHLYYARITHSTTSPPVFDVRQCPVNGADSSANPCF